MKSRSVTTKKLYIIGAGPKAVAIAAKAAVLQSLGYTVLDVTIVEKHEIGAHWVGRFGYTDGRLLLATAPYKDMGFPYDSRLVLDRSHRRKIDEKMLQRFSWYAFNIDGQMGRYAAELDRGGMLEATEKGHRQPTHGEYAQYLKWVAQRANADIRYAEVLEVESSRGKWRLACQQNDGSSLILDGGDGLVITSPGDPIKLRVIESETNHGLEAHARILDGKSVWLKLLELASAIENEEMPICIIGSGETAASVILSLSLNF